jgi:hypothetical protein
MVLNKKSFKKLLTGTIDLSSKAEQTFQPCGVRKCDVLFQKPWTRARASGKQAFFSLKALIRRSYLIQVDLQCHEISFANVN